MPKTTFFIGFKLVTQNITCKGNEKQCAQTHRIEKECQEELSPLDALVQDL